MLTCYYTAAIMSAPRPPHIEAANSAWTFDDIAGQFDAHIESSVPLYRQGHRLIAELAPFFLPRDGQLVEVGCSTGNLAAAVLAGNAGRADIRYLGIDPVKSMVDQARVKMASDSRAAFVCADLFDVELPPANLIVAYYTMQFICPALRQQAFDKLYNALEWGGALVLFEKVRAPDARFQDIASQLYSDYKLDNGFSEAAIVNKSRSLKGVLEPFSSQGNLDLLGRAGFVDVMTIAKWVNFEGFLAIK